MAEITKTASKSGTATAPSKAFERPKKGSPEPSAPLPKDKAKLSEKGKGAVTGTSVSDLVAKAKTAEKAGSRPAEFPPPRLTPAQELIRQARAEDEKLGLYSARDPLQTMKVEDLKRIFGRAAKQSTTVSEALGLADIAHTETDKAKAGAADIKKVALQKALKLCKTKDDAVSVAEKAAEVDTAFDSLHEEKAAAFSLAAKLSESVSHAIVLANHRNKDGEHDNYRAADAYKRALELAGSRSAIETFLDNAARNPRVSKEAYQELQHLSKPFYQRWFE